MSVLRADAALVARGLVASRARAQALIAAGEALANGQPIDKPAMRIDPDVALSLKSPDPNYASRGAVKLDAAMQAFGIDLTDRVALDLGASSGGFTDLMLRSGVKLVYAVDVGHGQLLARLAGDERVVALEGVDARHLTRTLIPQPIDVICADLSFISLTKALGPALALARARADLIALVKPQFEVGRAFVGKGGIVKDAAKRQAAVETVCDYLRRQSDWRILGVIESPIPGGDGNVEFLLHARKDL